MHGLRIVLLCSVAGCRPTLPTEPAGSSRAPAPELTWTEWTAAPLRGVVPAEWLPIPTSGWEFNGSSWARRGGEIADHNGDGRVDYIRITDPPSSYDCKIWIDHDRDGYFDVGWFEGVPDTDSADLREPRFRVPLFAPVNASMPAGRTAADR